jgi:hypothetical protein
MFASAGRQGGRHFGNRRNVMCHKWTTMKLTLYFLFISCLTFGQKFIAIVRPSSFSSLDTSKYGIQTDKFIFSNAKSKLYELDTLTNKIFLDSLYLFFTKNPTAIVEIDVKSFDQQKAATTMTLNTARSQSLVDFLVKNRRIQPDRLFAAGPKCPMPFLPDNIVRVRFIEPKKGVWTKITVLSRDYVPK